MAFDTSKTLKAQRYRDAAFSNSRSGLVALKGTRAQVLEAEVVRAMLYPAAVKLLSAMQSSPMPDDATPLERGHAGMVIEGMTRLVRSLRHRSDAAWWLQQVVPDVADAPAKLVSILKPTVPGFDYVKFRRVFHNLVPGV